MQTLVEDFLQYLRHERGQSENTAKTYAALLGKFTAWAAHEKLADWHDVELKHLMAFLAHERTRRQVGEPKESTKLLSGESVYLEIAALRAFYKFAENEKLLPANLAENLSLPRRWKRLPKALSNDEIKTLLEPKVPETPESLCDQAILELAYASGLRLSELKNLRLEQLHLDAGFINVIGKGAGWKNSGRGTESVYRIWPLQIGHAEVACECFFDTPRNALCRRNFVVARQKPRSIRGHSAQHDAAYAAPQFCHASAGAWRRLAGDSGITRPREHQHDGSLHARHGQPIAGNPPEVSPKGVSLRENFTQNRK